MSYDTHVSAPCQDRIDVAELEAAYVQTARQAPADAGWTDKEKSAFHYIFMHYGKRFVLYKQQAPVRACIHTNGCILSVAGASHGQALR